MNKRTKRLLGAIVLGVGTAGAFLLKKRGPRLRIKRGAPSRKVADVWARPGMLVIFRAELMPGRDSSERVFRIVEVLPSGRVLLEDFAGEHMEKEFEAIR